MIDYKDAVEIIRRVVDAVGGTRPVTNEEWERAIRTPKVPRPDIKGWPRNQAVRV